MFLLAAAATFLSAEHGLPTLFDVDVARVARIHECFGPDGMVHCRRIRNLTCSFGDRERTLARCSYEEWARSRPWRRQRIVLRLAGDEWEWVSGDEPRCSILIITDE